MQPYETRVLTRQELEALIGVLLFSGVMKGSIVRVKKLWKENIGPLIFAETMGLNRFRFLLRKLRFDDFATLQQQVAGDRFALFRDTWEQFIIRCQRNYQLSGYVTLDETMLSFHGRCGFVVYLPNKPDPYGLKLISLADATTFYFFNGVPYVGSEPQHNFSVPTQQALRVCQPIFGSHRNITTDNYFCSMELANELLQNGLTILGTMRKNRREIPKLMLRARRTDLHKSPFVYQTDRIMASFVPKPRKAVVMLSTVHVERGRIDQDNGKPAVINTYNRTKSGVDSMNQMMHTNSTKRKSRRWTMRYFFAMLDLAALNSFIIHRSNGGNLSRNNFLETLATQLVRPHCEWRLTSTRQLNKPTRFKIRRFLGLPLEEPRGPDQPARQGRPPERCKYCPRRHDRKGVQYCYACAAPMCGEHRRNICVDCYHR